MNIWALDKHQDIRHVLLLLAEQLGPDAFTLDLEASRDPCAVFLQHRAEQGVRAWLHVLGQAPGRYGLHLEYPATSETFDNLGLSSLVGVLAVHFDVSEIQPLP
ncbi:hypothetical protein [Stutzerimonas tarimensis]|uniref:Uncharacterized protein n=1 Tax=Stutzerimonas tarimensis TaxID=1507735 RepID=A0ABV7T2G3_9GAMM